WFGDRTVRRRNVWNALLGGPCWRGVDYKKGNEQWQKMSRLGSGCQRTLRGIQRSGHGVRHLWLAVPTNSRRASFEASTVPKFRVACRDHLKLLLTGDFTNYAVIPRSDHFKAHPKSPSTPDA